MKRGFTLLSTLVTLTFTLFSCRDCYECQQYEFCMDCIGSGTNGPVYFKECYATPSEREYAFQEIQAGQGGSNINCEMLENELEALEEACADKKDVEADMAFWEEEGYKCTLK